jgi:hypothetical protein
MRPWILEAVDDSVTGFAGTFGVKYPASHSNSTTTPAPKAKKTTKRTMNRSVVVSLFATVIAKSPLFTIGGCVKRTKSDSQLAPETSFNTDHQLLNGRLSHLIVDASSILSAGQKSAMLHHSQMLRGHMTGNLAGIGDFSDRQFALEHQLHHPKPDGMGQGSQALGGLLKMLDIQRFGGSWCFHIDIIS